MGKYSVLKFRPSCLNLFFAFVLVYVGGTLYWLCSYQIMTGVGDAHTDTCPACFGQSACLEMDRNVIQFRWKTVFSSSNQNVLPGLRIYSDKTSSIMVSKLADDNKFVALDRQICAEAKLQQDCDVSNAIFTLKFVRNPEDFVPALRALQSPMFFCPSTRLVDRMAAAYRERRFSVVTRAGLSDRERAQLWTTAFINAEPLFLQV